MRILPKSSVRFESSSFAVHVLLFIENSWVTMIEKYSFAPRAGKIVELYLLSGANVSANSVSYKLKSLCYENFGLSQWTNMKLI